jgi:hypothetical protein
LQDVVVERVLELLRHAIAALDSDHQRPRTGQRDARAHWQTLRNHHHRRLGFAIHRRFARKHDERHRLDSMPMRESLLDKDLHRATTAPVYRVLRRVQASQSADAHSSMLGARSFMHAIRYSPLA